MRDVSFTIIRDTREQKPYEFKDYPVSIRDQALPTGDYSVEGYETEFAIERKTKSDFLRSITFERDRFQREVGRATGFINPMVIVVEAPYIDFKTGRYFNDIPVKSITNTVASWQSRYNVDFIFEDDRSRGERRTYLQLTEWLLESS